MKQNPIIEKIKNITNHQKIDKYHKYWKYLLEDLSFDLIFKKKSWHLRLIRFVIIKNTSIKQ